MPLLTERLPVKEKLTDLQKLALFAPFFNRAKASQKPLVNLQLDTKLLCSLSCPERYDCQFCSDTPCSRHSGIQRRTRKYRKNIVDSSFHLSLPRWPLDKLVYQLSCWKVQLRRY